MTNMGAPETQTPRAWLRGAGIISMFGVLACAIRAIAHIKKAARWGGLSQALINAGALLDDLAQVDELGFAAAAVHAVVVGDDVDITVRQDG